MAPTLRLTFNCAIECTRALLGFYIYSHYKSRDEDMVGYMGDALRRFHGTKDAFWVDESANGRVQKRAC